MKSGAGWQTWQGGPGLLQSQAEPWLTWDETRYSLSPRAGAAATGVGGHSEGLRPYAELRALTPALTGGPGPGARGVFRVRRSAPLRAEEPGAECSEGRGF